MSLNSYYVEASRRGMTMTARVEATGPPDAARAILGKVPVGELKDVRVLVWPLKQDDLREFSATSLDFGVTEQ